MSKYMMTAILAGLAALSASALEIGKPIPVEKYGQIGAGGLLNYPLGAIRDADGKLMLFAYSSGCTMNKDIFSLYELVGEVSDGAPLFRKGERLLPPVYSKAKQRCHLTNISRVLKSRDGNIYGFFKTGGGYQRGKFNPQTFEFEAFGNILKLPPVCAVVENDDGSLFFYVRTNTVLKESEGTDLHPWNGRRYLPFDGNLIWRDGEVRQYLKKVSLPDIGSDKLSKITDASIGRAEGIVFLGGDSFKDEKGVRHLFAGTRDGGTLHYTINPDGTLSKARLCREGDVAMRAPQIHNSPIVALRDGKPDLYSGGEGGIFYWKFREFASDGTPVYEKAVRAREKDTNLFFGSLPQIDAIDWDGDGLTDIVIGNSQGELGLIKNVGKAGAPKFLEPKIFKKNGEDFVVKSGYWGVQGPKECQWGYIGATAVDWDGDGLLDLLTGDSTSRFGVYFNKGSAKNPNFSERKLLYCDSLEVHGTWRQRPGVAQLNNGRTAYVIADWDDQLRLYWKLDKFNLEDAGKLLLVDGKPITATGTRNGECGRVKISLGDVDGDGKTDILLGTIGCNAVPNFERGIPRNLIKGMKGAAVLWLKNVGDDDKPVFEYPRLMRPKSLPKPGEVSAKDKNYLGWHSCSVDMADFGGGLKGLLVGMEDGNLMFYRFEDVDWLDFDSLPRSAPKTAKKK